MPESASVTLGVSVLVIVVLSGWVVCVRVIASVWCVVVAKGYVC